jgi:outer membrane protein OmpA-like peptidoglycan-associated protein
VGGAARNQRLSERCAESVLAYAAEDPVDGCGTEGFGESRPVVPNTTIAGRRQNRRVELVVTGESIGRTDNVGEVGQ